MVYFVDSFVTELQQNLVFFGLGLNLIQMHLLYVVEYFFDLVGLSAVFAKPLETLIDFVD